MGGSNLLDSMSSAVPLLQLSTYRSEGVSCVQKGRICYRCQFSIMLSCSRVRLLQQTRVCPPTRHLLTPWHYLVISLDARSTLSRSLPLYCDVAIWVRPTVVRRTLRDPRRMSA